MDEEVKLSPIVMSSRILVILIIIAVCAGVFYFFRYSTPAAAPTLTPVLNAGTVSPSSSPAPLPSSDIPISRAKTRITKKPFGIFVSPNNSLVSPERFTGYHTGTDFEIFPGEESKDINVLALCDGTLALKEYARGYGGVAVENCVPDQEAVTVIYGHLRLASINAAKGDVLKRGEKIGVLGNGYSTETDGERKHLHLGVHKGNSIDILGYVQKYSDLSSWIDPTLFLY